MTPRRLSSTRQVLPDVWEEVQEFFIQRGMTDGLPVVPPTEERVWRMIDALGRPPDEVVAEVPPALGRATIEKLAINAVMAGCRPEYFPVVVAAVEALCEPKFNLTAIQATTNPVGPLLILNGPIRRRIGVNCEAGCFGPGWQANATLGRAVRLVLLNIGGGAPGPVDKAVQGYPGKYTFCFGENEEDSPWPPLHTERGFRPEDSVVTVVGAQGTSNILEMSPRPDDLLHTLAHGMINIGVNNFLLGQGEPLLVLNPLHARILAEAGWTKDKVREYLYEHVRAPLSWFSRRARESRIFHDRIVGDTVRIVRDPQQFMIVVAGSTGGHHSTFIPTFGDTLSVSRRIP
ncbi:MAG: hypothetical protein NZ951_01995 [Dehalococcoidia bacterium]|nr:hypothetical protein [Dehalococcoidia bacterium]MDW8119600.1 hypothetical protein [Chloroflexota bacterium]